MAYAIVKTGGKQYRVEKGQTLLVERLPDDVGKTVALEPLLFRSTDAIFDGAGLKKVSVKAKIIAHERGEKLRVFKFKPKRGYKRTAGHRQELTRLEITDVALAAGGRQAKSKRGAGGPAEVTPPAKGRSQSKSESEDPAEKSPAAGRSRSTSERGAGGPAEVTT